MKQIVINTIKKSAISLLLVYLIFLLEEPVVTRSAPASDSEQFIITQEVLGEI